MDRYRLFYLMFSAKYYGIKIIIRTKVRIKEKERIK